MVTEYHRGKSLSWEYILSTRRKFDSTIMKIKIISYTFSSVRQSATHTKWHCWDETERYYLVQIIRTISRNDRNASHPKK